jgi:two-component system, OmpR family, sensor histidine kinase ArlS
MGSMSKKLLHKTLRVYILFSLAVLVISAPLFYFFTEKLFIEDADETLFLHKNEFFTYNLPSMATEDIVTWNKVSRDVKIEQYSSSVKKDSVFYRSYLDTLANENEPYRVLLSPVTIEGAQYVFMARSNLIESEDLVINIATLFCLTLTLLLTGLYFITRRLSFKLWLPFYSTLKQVEQFELDKNVKPNFGVTDVEEFNRLNQSINRLLEKNLSVYKDQKEFIENASHELQTPIAVFQAKLDTLAQQLPFTNELSNTLSDLNDSISRLNRINKNLLLLSKIENKQFEALEEISVSDVLKRQVSFFAEQAEEKNINIHLKYIEKCVKRANSTLLEIAVSNLLLNALRHNHKNGQIVICLYNETLDISNSGTTTALQSEKLFQRFSHAGLGGGNGLGLAIVKKISDLHGWSLKYKYEEGMHSFQLSF